MATETSTREDLAARVRAAEEQYRVAGQAVQAEIAALFPIGSRVIVGLGGNNMPGTVIANEYWSGYPGELVVRPDRGKRTARRVHWTEVRLAPEAAS